MSFATPSTEIAPDSPKGPEHSTRLRKAAAKLGGLVSRMLFAPESRPSEHQSADEQMPVSQGKSGEPYILPAYEEKHILKPPAYKPREPYTVEQSVLRYTIGAPEWHARMAAEQAALSLPSPTVHLQSVVLPPRVPEGHNPAVVTHPALTGVRHS